MSSKVVEADAGIHSLAMAVAVRSQKKKNYPIFIPDSPHLRSVLSFFFLGRSRTDDWRSPFSFIIPGPNPLIRFDLGRSVLVDVRVGSVVRNSPSRAGVYMVSEDLLVAKAFSFPGTND